MCLGATFVVCVSVLAGFVLWLRAQERSELRRVEHEAKEMAALKALPLELKTQLNELGTRVMRLEALRITR